MATKYRITDGRTGKVLEGELVWISSSMDMTGCDRWTLKTGKGFMGNESMYVDEDIDIVEELD